MCHIKCASFGTVTELRNLCKILLGRSFKADQQILIEHASLDYKKMNKIIDGKDDDDAEIKRIQQRWPLTKDIFEWEVQPSFKGN